MFFSARLKLTFWYFIIITIICLVLTLPIYITVNHAFNQVEQAQVNKNIMPPPPFAKNIPEARTNTTVILFVTNGAIIFLGSFLGYFFAGTTLKPIKKMVDEQNRFISDASHELRTPLTALRSELDFLLLEYSLPEKVILHIKSSLEEVDNMRILTDDLLLLSRSQYLKNETSQEVSLLDVLESAIKKVVPLAIEKNITIDNQMKDVTLRTNHQTLSHVFIILLDNAIKYSDRNKKIQITSVISTDHVTIHVIDEGIGIDEESQRHIFERFYRGDKSRSKMHIAGYGLGLSIAERILETYKGKISVQSKPEKGSVFSVILPHTV